MTILYFLVCSGALLWGAMIVLKKYTVNNYHTNEISMVTMSCLIAGMLSLVLQIVLFRTLTFPLEFWLLFGILAICNLGFEYGETKALKTEDVDVVSSLEALSPAIVILTGWLFFREFPTIYGLIGILIVVFGIYILELTKKKERSSIFKPFIGLASSKGARIALIVALLGAIAINFDKMVVVKTNPFMANTNFLLAGMVAYWMAKSRSTWKRPTKKSFPLILVLGLLLAFSNYLMDAGFFFGIVSYISTLKRTYLIWATIFASIFLKEKCSFFQIIAISFIVFGIVLISF